METLNQIINQANIQVDVLPEITKNQTTIHTTTQRLGTAKAIIDIAKQKYPNFVLDEETKELFGTLKSYFLGNESDLDNNKGIFLYGEIGCGKTSTMKIFETWLRRMQHENKFSLYSIRQIEKSFNLNSYNGLEKYITNPVMNEYRTEIETPYNLCIDDAGTESEMTANYSQKINVFRELILDRYELFIENKIKTHVTTNLPLEKIKERYDSRITDRLKEMFNFVKVKGKSKRV